MSDSDYNENESPFYYRFSKTDREQFDFMIQKSETARKCKEAYLEEDKLQHAAHLIDLVKMGYSRDELKSFLKVLYTFQEDFG